MANPTTPPGGGDGERERGEFAPSRAFRFFTGILLLFFAGILFVGALHRSDTPELLGRYSVGYAAALAGVAGLTLFLCLLLVRPSRARVVWTQNAYAFLVSTLVAVVAVEVGLRAFAPWGIDFFHWLPYHMQGMVTDPELGYAHPRSVAYRLGSVGVALNSHGLRDEEITHAKAADEQRILALGDSVTFGWGVDQGEAFADRMEPLLRERTGARWQVVNAGVNGYNSEQQAAFLESRGWQYSPEIVILVFVDNDVDARLVPNATTWRRYPQWPASLPEALDRVRQLSYLNQLTHVMVRLQPERKDGAKASITRHPRWTESKDALRRIAAACEARKVPFLVAHLGGGDDAFFAELNQEAIATMSLGPGLDKVAPGQRHVSRVDPHPAAPVHAVFAELIVDELGRRGWLAARDEPAATGALSGRGDGQEGAGSTVKIRQSLR